MIFITENSINRIITYYTHAYHNHPEKGKSFFHSQALKVIYDLVEYATLHMKKSNGPTITTWDANGWQKYNSTSYPWCYAIANDGVNVYVSASEQEKNVADLAPHDTGFTQSVSPSFYSYYANGGLGFDVVKRIVNGRNLFNFMYDGKIVFYMDFTSYLPFNNDGIAHGWGTNGIEYELFSDGKMRKFIPESVMNKLIMEVINSYLRENLLPA